MAQPYTVEAIVLRQRPLGEHDAIVVLLSRERGKLSAVAKGVKRPHSKLAAVIQPFVWGRYFLARGGKMALLTQGEVHESFYPLREDVWRVAYATYCCELLERALPEAEPHPALFDLLRTTLTQLLRAEETMALAHSFELRALALLGYEPDLERCLGCKGAVDGKRVFFSAARGGLLCESCRDRDRQALPICEGTVQYLRLLLHPGQTDLTRVKISGRSEGELAAVLRAHIRYHLETEPRSARFLRTLRAAETDLLPG
ncbi:MAG TPA: DNA repair protein RecO [Armatimonadetes bacterium]|nr:DNA repair protein RecO [Armatimonadota bacterium]